MCVWVGKGGEREKFVINLNNRSWGLLSHVVDGILVSQPVTTLHCVIHVPLPIILLHIA